MKNNHLKYFYWFSTILWMVIIFIESSIGDFSSITGDDKSTNELLSSIAHVVIFSILTLLWLKSLILSGVDKRKAIAYAFIISIVYGALDEFHQFFVPGREVHVSDWLLDFVGSLAVATFYSNLYKK